MKKEKKSINKFDKNGKEIFDGDVIKISSRGLDFICYIDANSIDIVEPYDDYSKKWEHMLYSPDWDSCEVIV